MEAKLVTGEIVVRANDFAGAKYVNDTGRPLRVQFTPDPNETWTFHLGDPPPQYSSLGRTSNGWSEAATPGYRLPGAPKACMVVWAKGAYREVGESLTLTMDPSEEVAFSINDNNNAGTYADNTGLITVRFAEVLQVDGVSVPTAIPTTVRPPSNP